MSRTELMGTSQVASTAARVIRGEATDPALVQAARDAIQAMFRESEVYGIAPADVIRAVLLPVLENQRGCGCHSCKTRQDSSPGERSRVVAGSNP